MEIIKKWKTATSLVLVFLFLAGLMGSPSIASAADTTININGSSHFTGTLVLKSDPLVGPGGGSLDNAAWFPGLAKHGTVCISNSYFYKVKISSITLGLEYADAAKRSLLANNMWIKIQKDGDPASIYDGKFAGLLSGANVVPPIVIDRLGSANFNYIVTMDANAPNELQGLDNIKLSLMFSTEEVPAPVSSDSSSGGGGSGGGTYQVYLSDMSPGHWAYDCTQALLLKGFLDVEKGNKISPDENITRAEIAVILAKALGIEPVDKFFSGYLDPLPDWARGYIIALSEAGIFKGYPGFLFKPNNGISREELTCVLVRAFNLKLNGDFELDFPDKDKISGWALESMKIAVQNGIISGYPDGTLGPQNFITRAEVFSILCRLLGLHDDHKS